jgi:hypothetical protein
LPRPPEFRLPPQRDRGWWWALAASVVVHVLLLSVRASDWFWKEGTPPQVRFIPLPPNIPQVEMQYRPPQPATESEPRRRREINPPVTPEPEQPPSQVAAAEPPGVPEAPRDTAAEAVAPPVNAPRGIPLLRPQLGEGKLWVKPLPLAPQELAQRLTRSHYELVDSAVSEIVQQYIDSMLATPNNDNKLPSWTTKIAGKTFGIDQNYIHLGGLKIPSAVLALLPIPQVSNVDLRSAQRLNDIRADLQYAAQRAQTMEDFKRAIRELRERREREAEFERNQRRAPADTTPP